MSRAAADSNALLHLHFEGYSDLEEVDCAMLVGRNTAKPIDPNTEIHGESAVADSKVRLLSDADADDGALETLFPGLEVIPPILRGSGVWVGDTTVVKTLYSGVLDEMPKEFAIQQMLSLRGASASSGIVALTSVEREVIEGSSALWTATMPKCPVTLDCILPLLKLMMNADDAAQNHLAFHILFAVYASLVRMLETFEGVGIVHFDLKLENIGLTPDQDNGAQSAFDFGEAKYVGQQVLAPSGTVPYMAPEVPTCGISASPAQDVYSMGCVLNALVCGDKPATPYTASSAAIVGYFIDQAREYNALHIAEMQKFSSSGLSGGECIRRASLERRELFCATLAQFTDFKSCLLFVIAEMCATLLDYRPVLASLKLAEKQLQHLLPPLQSGYSVAGFFQRVAGISPKHEMVSLKGEEERQHFPSQS